MFSTKPKHQTCLVSRNETGFVIEFIPTVAWTLTLSLVGILLGVCIARMATQARVGAMRQLFMLRANETGTIAPFFAPWNLPNFTFRFSQPIPYR